MNKVCVKCSETIPIYRFTEHYIIKHVDPNYKLKNIDYYQINNPVIPVFYYFDGIKKYKYDEYCSNLINRAILNDEPNVQVRVKKKVHHIDLITNQIDSIGGCFCFFPNIEYFILQKNN